MSKTAKNALIAGAACVALAIAAVVLLLTAPKNERESSSETSVSQSQEVQITSKSADNVLAITVQNEYGSFTFNRKTRGSAGDDGTVSASYYWTSDELLGVGQSDSAVRSFIGGFASLTAKSVVEENADDLEKYGLNPPRAAVSVSFDDGTKTELYFGIENPANTSTVYFREGDRVMLAYTNGVSGAFKDIKDYANLLITKALGDDEQVDYITVTRKDLEEPIEISYMSELAAARDDENYVVSTLNTHRFTAPYNAEINVSKGGTIVGGVCGLTMKECAYLEANAENLAKCGLDDPFCTVKFSYGGEERTLLLGDKAKQVVSESSSDTPQLYEVTGYYAALVGVPGIFVISTQAAPWYDFNPADYVSARPVSAYIYGCESVEISASGEVYTFEINAESKTISLGEKAIDGENFRKFFEQLVGSIGEEVYTGEVVGEPAVSVKFSYADDYAKLYGAKENTLCFYGDGERKNTVTLDGKPIFKVRSIYTERLLENVQKLLDGEDVNIIW